ncbi:MAG: ferrous iron transport protein A [Gammaproteobacteria bacterium]|nr:ferrous iron transport protein A [Gammaproteobacteria bacterium]
MPNANHYHLRMANGDITLASLKNGQIGTIRSIDATDPQVQRLMVLGLVEGTQVQQAGAAIGGDPIEFRFFGSGISLRREQAMRFTVTHDSVD